MSDTEYAAYFEAFGAIKNDYQALCLIGDKLREVEMTAQNLGPLESQSHPDHAELPDTAGGRSPWEMCASLMRLNQNEVLLCRRICEHGIEYAVMDRSSVACAYSKANGPHEILQTGDNPRHVLRDYLRNERQALELMTNDITANVRLLIAERFPKHDLRRVANEIIRLCKKVARLGFSESIGDMQQRPQTASQGVRV